MTLDVERRVWFRQMFNSRSAFGGHGDRFIPYQPNKIGEELPVTCLGVARHIVGCIVGYGLSPSLSWRLGGGGGGDVPLSMESRVGDPSLLNSSNILQRTFVYQEDHTCSSQAFSKMYFKAIERD